jgi:hypothetical protein
MSNPKACLLSALLVALAYGASPLRGEEKPPQTAEEETEEGETRKDPFQGTFHGPQEAMKAMKAREPSAPKAGQEAPDFELQDPSGKKTVKLSDFEGKAPVVLLFGSYT